MDQDSLDYQKSIALEFSSYRNRVRNLIGSAHWGEEGRYKEIILMNFLKRFLPNTVEVATGFVKDGNNISTQIDIIIYNPALPVYFKENDFVIVQPNSVLGIIEVKSNPGRSAIGDAIYKANKIEKIVQKNNIFNGLFIYGQDKKSSDYLLDIQVKSKYGKFEKSLLHALPKKNGINHIVSINGAFIKKWDDNKFSCYAIQELAVGYFFSNLLDKIDSMINLFGIQESMYDHLYPISEGKKNHLSWELILDSLAKDDFDEILN